MVTSVGIRTFYSRDAYKFILQIISIVVYRGASPHGGGIPGVVCSHFASPLILFDPFSSPVDY